MEIPKFTFKNLFKLVIITTFIWLASPKISELYHKLPEPSQIFDSKSDNIKLGVLNNVVPNNQPNSGNNDILISDVPYCNMAYTSSKDTMTEDIKIVPVFTTSDPTALGMIIGWVNNIQNPCDLVFHNNGFSKELAQNQFSVKAPIQRDPGVNDSFIYFDSSNRCTKLDGLISLYTRDTGLDFGMKDDGTYQYPCDALRNPDSTTDSVTYNSARLAILSLFNLNAEYIVNYDNSNLTPSELSAKVVKNILLNGGIVLADAQSTLYNKQTQQVITAGQALVIVGMSEDGKYYIVHDPQINLNSPQAGENGYFYEGPDMIKVAPNGAYVKYPVEFWLITDNTVKSLGLNITPVWKISKSK